MRGLSLALAIVLAAGTARASSAAGYPEEGSEPMGRAGAWVARASDPIAIARNPAGLAGQPLRLSLGADVALRSACMTRVKSEGDTTGDGVAPGASYPRVCDDAAPLPVGFVALTVPLGPRAAVGLGIVTPHGVPRASWPAFAEGRAAPQRYLLLDSTVLMAIPTASFAYEVWSGLRLGASLGWGVAWVRTSAAAPALATAGIDPAVDDVKLTVTAADAFVPRATVGAHASILPFLEAGASFMASAPIEAGGFADTEANAFTARAATGDDSKIAHGRVRDVALTVPLPMEASLGVRARVPRGEPARRDPLDEELFDVELDLTWSQSSAMDGYGLRFPTGFLVPGTAGTLPARVDIERRHRDVLGLRLGGDVNVVPSVLALRAGAFFEPAAGVPGFTGPETFAGARAGASVGATARIAAPGGRALDVSVAFLHMAVADVSATGDGAHAVTGAPPHRTSWPVGLGTREDALDVLHLGLAYRLR